MQIDDGSQIGPLRLSPASTNSIAASRFEVVSKI